MPTGASLGTQFERRLIGQTTFRIEFLPGIGDIDMRHIERKGIERNADLSQVELPAGGAEWADGRARVQSS